MPRKLAGLGEHRVTFIPIGERRRWKMPAGGWVTHCSCGWKAEPVAGKRLAREGFNDHLATSKPRCSRCRQLKERAEMAVSATQRCFCKKCITEKTRQWAERNPEEWKAQRRRSHLKKKYGITPERYDELLAAQGGACAICRGFPSDPRGFNLHVDHDHTSGLVRGLLCFDCNRGLGCFADDVAHLRAATQYLLKFSELAE